MPVSVEDRAIKEDFLADSARCVRDICAPYSEGAANRRDNSRMELLKLFFVFFGVNKHSGPAGADIRKESYKKPQDYIKSIPGALPKLTSTDKTRVVWLVSFTSKGWRLEKGDWTTIGWN